MKKLILGLIISTLLIGTSFAANPFYQDKGKYLILTGNKSTSYIIKKDIRSLKSGALSFTINSKHTISTDDFMAWETAYNALIKIVIANAK
jgi:hypothetical protein